MKIVYIAHPISGDQEGNVKKILEIIKDINLNMPGVVPFAPYIPDCLCMDDSIPEQRQRGIDNDVELIRRGFIDELWLYGPGISKGMMGEIHLFEGQRKPIIAKSLGTKDLWDNRGNKQS